MSKIGTVRRIPSRKVVGTLIRAANTNPEGSREARRKRFKNFKKTYKSPWGWKGMTKTMGYWCKRVKKRRIRRKLALVSQRRNRV